MTHFVVTFVDGREASLAEATNYNVRPQLVILCSSAR